MTRFMPLPGEEPGFCPAFFRSRSSATAEQTRPTSQTSESPLIRQDIPAHSERSSTSGPAPVVLPRHLEPCSDVDASERLPGELKERLQQLGPRFRVVKWVAPLCLLLFSLLIQNFGLYWATYRYVTRMDHLEASLQALEAEHGGVERLLGSNTSTNSSHVLGLDPGRSRGTKPLHSTAISHASTLASNSSGVESGGQVANVGNLRSSRGAPSSHHTSDSSTSGSIAPGAIDAESSDMPSWMFFKTISDAALDDAFLDLASNPSLLSGAALPSSAMLDILSEMIPIIFLAFALLAKDLRVWTKCCLCGSLLALLKAFLARTTLLPDSAGWEICKERLGPDRLGNFRVEDFCSFKHGFLFGLFDVLRLDVVAVWLQRGESRYPFCADMMFSGHAYCYAIFSLGLYDLVRKHTAPLGLLARPLCRFLAGAVLLVLMCCDVESAIANRFHYTMDIVIALVLSLLIFSSPAIAAATEFWAVDLDAEHNFLESVCAGSSVARSDKDLGDLLVPPCCFPLCCFPGRYHLSSLPDRQEAFEQELGQLHDSYGGQLQNIQKQLAELREEHQRCEEERQQTEAQLMSSIKQAQRAAQAKDEQHAGEIDSLQQSLALEKGKSQELGQSLTEHRSKLQDQEERHHEEQRSLQAQLEEESVCRKRFEERSQTLAQVLVVRENERQEAAALLLGAREVRKGGDALEHAAALVAGLGLDSPAAKPVEDISPATKPTQDGGPGSQPGEQDAHPAPEAVVAVPGEVAPAEEAVGKNVAAPTDDVAQEFASATSGGALLESPAISSESEAALEPAVSTGIQSSAITSQAPAVEAGQASSRIAADALAVGGTEAPATSTPENLTVQGQ
mmetsp:Transcript_45156/g.130755  ORF Transcript_45156/g.130755 Transcript_45156/m.130755 type:complete len:850 (-) Transcript_45156:56-2605(-)